MKSERIEKDPKPEYNIYSRLVGGGSKAKKSNKVYIIQNLWSKIDIFKKIEIIINK